MSRLPLKRGRFARLRMPLLRRLLPLPGGPALLAGMILAILLLAGCAGELPVPGQTLSTVAVATTATTEALTVQLAKQVAATWSEAIQKLVLLLEPTPPVTSLQAPVAQLKEEYVQKMVALGRQIAALDGSQRQETYASTTEILSSTADSDWFLSYTRLYNQYAAGSDQTAQDFAVLLSSFNTLTQYAFFDLLREQDPDEAQRLGIE
jgi:hypothetical protein